MRRPVVQRLADTRAHLGFGSPPFGLLHPLLDLSRRYTLSAGQFARCAARCACQLHEAATRCWCTHHVAELWYHTVAEAFAGRLVGPCRATNGKWQMRRCRTAADVAVQTRVMDCSVASLDPCYDSNKLCVTVEQSASTTVCTVPSQARSMAWSAEWAPCAGMPVQVLLQVQFKFAAIRLLPTASDGSKYRNNGC